MTAGVTRPPFDVRLLNEATTTLLGYFVHTWFRHYLSLIAANLHRWTESGAMDAHGCPTELGKQVAFDFDAIDIEKLAYITGIGFYLVSCHKCANYQLTNRSDGKQVLYLRGFDYEGSMLATDTVAVGFSTVDTARFNWKLAELMAPHCQLFKALSPKDIYWEIAGAQKHFYGDFADMIPHGMTCFEHGQQFSSWESGTCVARGR